MKGTLGGLLALAYGVAVYAIFFVAFVYAILFIGDVSQIGPLSIPKTIDSGMAGPRLTAVLVDLVVLGIFAVQHSLMARPAFKRLWTRIVPPSIERSTYVLFSSLALILILWQWRPIDQPVWTVVNPLGVLTLHILFWAGWAILFISTFLINHFELFGLRQVWSHLRRVEIPQSRFHTPLFYKFVRHPLYLGFIISFWSTPVMTRGHLFFALATTGYIFIGIWLEERDLTTYFGDTYTAYRKRVSMIVPLPPRR